MGYFMKPTKFVDKRGTPIHEGEIVLIGPHQAGRVEKNKGLKSLTETPYILVHPHTGEELDILFEPEKFEAMGRL